MDRVAAVVLVLVLFAATLWFLKRQGIAAFSRIRLGTSGERRREMVCIERMTLTPQHSLHLVRVRNRILVVGVAPAGCNLIQDCGAPGPDEGALQ